MNKENPGRVLKVTANLMELTGWLPYEIINNDINLLMPEFMANDHPDVLLSHLKNLYANEKSERMHQTLNTFILHKSGFIMPCDIYLTFHPYIQETPVYVGFIKFREVQFEKIPLNALGEIEGFTERIGEFLGLAKAEGNLESFCTNFSEVSKHMEDLASGAESKQFFIHFRLTPNHPGTFMVSLNLRCFNKKPYYILSFKKTDLNLNQSDAYFSDDFEEVPKGYNRNTPLPILLTGASQRSERLRFAETQAQEEERSPTQPKLNTRFLTTENARLNTVNSFVAEEHFQTNAILSSQRSLLGISPKFNPDQTQDIRKPQTPTSVGSTSKRFKTRLELALTVVPKNRLLGFLFWSIILFMITSVTLLIIFNNQASTTFSTAVVRQSAIPLQDLQSLQMCKQISDFSGKVNLESLLRIAGTDWDIQNLLFTTFFNTSPSKLIV